jgi:hypothetical protein
LEVVDEPVMGGDDAVGALALTLIVSPVVTRILLGPR